MSLYNIEKIEPAIGRNTLLGLFHILVKFSKKKYVFYDLNSVIQEVESFRGFGASYIVLKDIDLNTQFINPLLTELKNRKYIVILETSSYAASAMSKADIYSCILPIDVKLWPKTAENIVHAVNNNTVTQVNCFLHKTSGLIPLKDLMAYVIERVGPPRENFLIAFFLLAKKSIVDLAIVDRYLNLLDTKYIIFKD